MTLRTITPSVSLRSCPHESELKALLDAGHWPQAAPAELRAHAASCRACSSLALLTSAFRAERAAASASVQLPPPGLLWWRAQLRRRNQALERINRPILGAQLFALVTACLATIGFLFFVRHSLSQWLTSLTDPSASHSSPLASLFSPGLLHAASSDSLSLLWSHAFLLPLLALFLLAGGVTLWLASERN